MSLNDGPNDPEKEVLEALVKEAKKYRLLTRDEEQHWIGIYKDSLDFSKRKQALDVLVTRNLKLTFNHAKKYPGGTLTTYDLIIEGVLGLIHAIDKYDRSRVTDKGLPLKLSTYATWWIKQYIQRAVQDKGRTIRIPIHKWGEIDILRKAHGKFCSTHPDRTGPTSFELSMITKIPEPTVKLLGTYLFDISSIDAASSDDEDSLSISEGLVADTDKYTTDAIEPACNKSELIKLLNLLPDEDCKFMMLKYALVDGIDRTSKEMAVVYKCKPREIDNREKLILAKLKEIGNANRFSL